MGDEPVLMDEFIQQANAQMKCQSRKTGAYTQLKDKMLCEAWMTIGQHIGRKSMTSSRSIDMLGPKPLRAIAMNCPFKRGECLSKRNVTKFVEHMRMCSM
jgi:hypothetical protein